MLFRLIYDDSLAQAAYLIGCQRTGEALLIDPERDIDRYLAIAHREKVRITAVTETHIHADFLSGVREVAEATGAKVYLSDCGPADWKYQWLDQKAGGGRYNAQLLKDGDAFAIGNIQVRVIHTPGHTPEHICFEITDRGGGATEPMGIATGDFVFVGDVGRPDLLESAAGMKGAADSAAKQLFSSVRAFGKLPDYLQLWPGHGAGSACGKALGAVPQSTVGYEKRFNPAIRAAGTEAEFLGYVLEGQPEPPLYFARMKRLNKSGPPVLGKLPKPAELSADQLRAIDARATAILDTRPWSAFRAGHIRGTLHCPLNANFAAVAGSYVKEGEPIVLIAEPASVEHAVRCLVRIGLDTIAGFATPASVAGMPLIPAPEIDVKTLKERIDAGGAAVLDVRRASEFAEGHIDGARNIAHTRLMARLEEVPKGKPILVHCQGGTRSAFATAMLERAGYDATNIAGGYGAWEAAGLPTVR
jgi:hydroxyacylglutathione hydrolase